MIPTITPEQRRAIDEHHGQPVFVADTDRRETFVLLSSSDYQRVRGLLTGPNGSGDWTDEKDDRRCDLIDRDIAGTLTEEERAELAELKCEAPINTREEGIQQSYFARRRRRELPETYLF